MTALRAIGMAFSLYSRIPMPRLSWTGEGRRWTLCAFPLVGGAVGGMLLLWLLTCKVLILNGVLRAVGGVLLPLAVTGGIHMDGFCDVWDAQSSHQDRVRKLEIMKDSHVGAFAVLGCVGYLLLAFGLWTQADLTPESVKVLVLVPVLSRSLSGYGALRLPKARAQGMLAAVSGEKSRPGRFLLLLWVFLCALAMGWNSWCGMAAVAAALTAYLYYVHTALGQFGGTTGDLAGWFLQNCELACLAAVVFVQRLEAVL